ncbi:MFS-type transporter SLC18B1-like isoform X2 [Brevipalpus obovatus]|uniref:MFS-type transporter SLC18B1-like isoform X2 n=1 Tax=Brevipalpus obovatus TaxID=246614 RepID=UPI003D9E9ABC
MRTIAQNYRRTSMNPTRFRSLSVGSLEIGYQRFTTGCINNSKNSTTNTIKDSLYAAKLPPTPPSSDDSTLSSTEQVARSKVKFNDQQKWILLCLCLVDFSAFASMSIIAPFFPYEVSLRGQSTYISGLIFSVYSITVVFSSAIFGRLSPYIGPRLMLIVGTFISGTANIVFGLLDYINDDTAFIVLCFVVRIIEALGAASFNTASLIYIFEMFPDNVGYVFGLTETFTTLGTTLGPALGGLLYSWMGYGTPFYVLGTFAFLTLPMICMKVPRISTGNRSRETNATYFGLLRIPKVAIICMVVVVISQSIGFLDPTLEPFYRSLGLNVNSTALAFFVLSATIAILLPIFSRVADRTENEYTMMFTGLIICAVGLLFLGPSDFIPISPSLSLSLLSLVIIAVGYALAFIPTFESLLDSAIDHGMHDNIATYGVVSGLWSTCYAAGEVTGPSLGGALLEFMHFSAASSLMALFSILMAIVTGFAMIWKVKSQWK